MSHVRWTRRARADLDAYIDYLRDRNPRAAVEAAQDLDEAANLLARFGGMGRAGDVSGTREFSMPRWHKVIVYRLLDEQTEILTLRDTRRLYRPRR